jgi:hypothetical protein
MTNSRRILVAILLAGAVIITHAAPFEQIDKTYNRATSRIMIRSIASPTLAALDYAAYTANIIRFDPGKVSLKKPAEKVGLPSLTFSGALTGVCVSLSQTPLTDQEQAAPMAWDPLQNELWKVIKSDEFAKIGLKIIGEKWADPSVFMPYQEIAALFLHGRGDSTQAWVKIEFKPWVKFLDQTIPDADKDGFREIYGRLNIDAIDADLRRKTFEWIRHDYGAKILTKEQVVDWANLLASYWYPKLNTDMVDMTGHTAWPNSDTEKEIAKGLKGLVVQNPLVVIRGNPLGKKLYNVFVVDFPAEKPATTAGTAQTPAETSGLKLPDTTVSVSFKDNNARFQHEIKVFGTYTEWAKKDEPLRAAMTAYIKTLPETQMGLVGKDDWLFFRGEINYMNCGDMATQAKDKNPIPHLIEFNKFCNAHNIALLFVPVPNKSDVYFEKLPAGTPPKDPETIINPYGRKMLNDLQAAGIEVIDLLPAFLAAKKEDTTYAEAVYQRHDTHWTDRGLEIAADMIADRIRKYAWYPELAKAPVHYTRRDTTFIRQGDIVDKLPDADKTRFQAVDIAAKKVYNPDGTPFKGANTDAPIMLMGDSFTGVFELVDCKSAGVGAHIAANTGIPVDIITSWGGGPLVRDKMYRARKDHLAKKRVIIYMMVARDLYNYSQSWLPLETK